MGKPPKYYKYQGGSRTLAEWAELYKMSRGCLERRIYVKKMSLAEALKMPVGGSDSEQTPEEIRYQRLKAKGICVDCGVKKKTLGHIRCQECQERREKEIKARREESKNERRSPRATSAGKAIRRLCNYCDKPFMAIGAIHRCPKCTNYFRKYQVGAYE